MTFLAKIILLSLIFLLPTIGPVENFGYEEAKVLFFIIITTLAGFILVPQFKNIKWTALKKSALIFLLVLGLSAALGVDRKTSFLGQPPYFQGWGLYAYLFLFFLMVSTIKAKQKYWEVILAASASWVSFLAIKDWVLLHFLNVSVPTYAGRIVSTFGQPNFLAGFLLLSLPFTFSLVRDSKGWLGKLSLVGMVGEVLGILVSQSKMAVGLLVVLFLGWMVLRLSGNIRKIMVILTVGTILASLLGSWYLSSGLVWEELDKPWRRDWVAHEFPDRGFFLWQLSWSKDAEKRIYIWPVVGDLIIKRPILGYGLENLPAVFATSQLAQFHGIKDLGVDRSHNQILDILFFSGLAGLLAFGVMVVYLFKRAGSMVLILPLILYLLWAQVQNQSVVHLIYFWLIAGFIDQQGSA